MAAVTFTSATVGEVAVTGVRKVGAPTPASRSDLWHVGSITKSYTSALVGKFVEQGKLSWSITLGELVGVGRAGKFCQRDAHSDIESPRWSPGCFAAGFSEGLELGSITIWCAS
jgi:hypothetical protein